MFATDFVSTHHNQSPQNVRVSTVSSSDLLFPSPWLLVPTGSYNGYFDWVPKHLRVGPWSVSSIIALPLILLGAMWSTTSTRRPTAAAYPSFAFCTSAYPPAFSWFWLYNVIVTCWMAFVLGRNIRHEGWAMPYTTFTVWSWTMLLLRHALTALAALPIPLFYDEVDTTRYGFRVISQLAECLRCPALLNSVVVFVVWNLVLAPGIYLTLETTTKRKQFIRWLFQFNLINQHFLSLPLAITSAIVSAPRQFTDADLWCGLASVVSYLLFYILVLDRLGVHLYPIFSPRSKYCALVWSLVIVGYGALFRWIQHGVMTSYETLC